MADTSTSSLTVLAVALLTACPLTASGNDSNLITDPGFELETPSDLGGWTLFEESRFSDRQARSGAQSMFNFGFSRSVPYHPFLIGTVSGSFQEFAAEVGSRWRLTGFGMTPEPLAGTPAFGIIQISFFDADGNDLGTVETFDDKTARAKLSNEINNQSPSGEWIFLDTEIATAPEGTATVQAFTLYVDYSDSKSSQGVYFDDLNLCMIDDDSDRGECSTNAEDPSIYQAQ